MLRRGRSVAVALTLIVALLCVSERPSSAAEGEHIRWLAAGDSYSSGLGIPGASEVCLRSPKAWPHKAKSSLDTEFDISRFDFVACAGAVATIQVVGNDWASQRGEAMSTLTSDDGPYNLITFTFGGNDVGFDSTLTDCIIPRLKFSALLTLRIELGCTSTPDQLTGRIANFESYFERFLQSLLDDTELLAPDGHVVFAGYPRLFAEPEDWPAYVFGSCQGVLERDVRSLNTAADELNAALARAAKSVSTQRIHFVDLARAGGFEDHALCNTKESWLNGLSVPLETSFHPGDKGSSEYAQLFSNAIRRLRFTEPAPAPSERTYTTDCAGATKPVTVRLHNGVAEVSDRNGFPAGVSLVRHAQGDLLGDAKAESAVMLRCDLEANYAPHEVQVFGSDGSKLAALVLPDHGDGPDIQDFDPDFLGITGRKLRTSGFYYDVGDCHAGGPSLHYDISWTWTNDTFSPAFGRQRPGPGTPCLDAEGTAKRLFELWGRHDRDGAARYAQPQVLEYLFDSDYGRTYWRPTQKFDGCYEQERAPVLCSFGDDSSGVSFFLSQGNVSWLVVDADLND